MAVFYHREGWTGVSHVVLVADKAAVWSMNMDFFVAIA